MNSDEIPAERPVRDALVGLGLSALAVVLVLVLSGWTAPFVAWREFDNLYFHSDIALVFSNMTDFGSNHYRTGMHPGFSLFSAFSVEAIRSLTGVSGFRAVQLLLAANAGVQTALLFMLLRRLPLGLPAAAAFVLLFLASATMVFWHTVAETFAFGGTSLLIMLLIVSSPAPGNALLVLGNVVTMSMTMTNWMAAFYGTVWHRWRRWRTVLGIFFASGLLILLTGIVSKLTFPSAGYVGDFRRYLAWVRLPQPGDWPAFFGHSLVMPDPVYDVRDGGFLAVTVEPALLGSGTAAAPVALMIWLALLVAGGVGLWMARRRALSAVLGLTALSQLGLHSFFSDGPFLFAAHFTPLLILVAAHAALLPRVRLAATGLALVLALLAGVNNAAVFGDMTERLTAGLLPALEAGGTPPVRPAAD